MKYRAIFLDMDHTICDTDSADRRGVEDFIKALSPELGDKLSHRVGNEYLRVIYGGNKLLPDWQRQTGESETGYRARLLSQTILNETGMQLPAGTLVDYTRLFMELRMKHFDFFPETEEMLARLRRNHKLVVVTNGPLFSQEPKVKRVDLPNHVDEIILGGALEHQKPHPSIFELACRKACCTSSEAIHVGDRLDSDIQGAANAGITSVWLTAKDGPENPSPRPDHIIHEITELEELLHGLHDQANS